MQHILVISIQTPSIQLFWVAHTLCLVLNLTSTFLFYFEQPWLQLQLPYEHVYRVIHWGTGELPEILLSMRVIILHKPLFVNISSKYNWVWESLSNHWYNFYWLTFVQLNTATELIYPTTRLCPQIIILLHSYPFTNSCILFPLLKQC